MKAEVAVRVNWHIALNCRLHRGTPQNLDWLDELNPEQQRAVAHDEGPILVSAGAGSGKTRTLASRRYDVSA